MLIQAEARYLPEAINVKKRHGISAQFQISANDAEVFSTSITILDLKSISHTSDGDLIAHPVDRSVCIAAAIARLSYSVDFVRTVWHSFFHVFVLEWQHPGDIERERLFCNRGWKAQVRPREWKGSPCKVDGLEFGSSPKHSRATALSASDLSPTISLTALLPVPPRAFDQLPTKTMTQHRGIVRYRLPDECKYRCNPG